MKNLDGIKFKAGLAICMDINPYEFIDPTKFELADHMKTEKIDVLLFISAWLKNEEEETTNELA